jgi:putative membrane protein
MNLRSYRGLQALVMAGLGLFLISLGVEGHILEILNRQLVFLALMMGLALVFLAQHVFRNRPAIVEEQPEPHALPDRFSYPRWSIFLLVLSLLIGLLVPERPLGLAAVRSRGVQRHYAPAEMADDRSQTAAQEAYQLSPDQRGVLDWLRIAGADPSGNSYTGQPADVTGFIYHDPVLPSGQFLLCRFVVTNSLADARALGMLVTWPGAADLPDATWVRVRGTVNPLVQEYRLLPTITAGQVDTIPEPGEPYLYP